LIEFTQISVLPFHLIFLQGSRQGCKDNPEESVCRLQMNIDSLDAVQVSPAEAGGC
jgi:hypothetical protein